ncbi:MAG: MurR/RpiR family transcriptional regulator [Actinomycetota bacterium]|nr:MurR/RpiR family transcriptional regulator [Actinomycetota bacterium]
MAGTTTSETHQSVPVIEVIRSQLPALSGAERRVAEVVVADPDHVMHSSVSDIASEAGTSLSTVVRFCQTLGLAGFQALKIGLARGATGRSQPLPLGVGPDDDPTTVARGVLHEAAASLTRAAEGLEDGVLEAAVAAVAAARRVLVVAVGTSTPLAQDLAYRLKTVGVDAEAPGDVHVQHVSARLLDSRDVSIAISHTGSTVETVTATKTARDAGAGTVGITSFRRSPLTEQLDVAIVGGSPETAVRVEAVASRLVHLALVDALVVALVLHLGAAAQTAQDLTSDVLDQHRF